MTTSITQPPPSESPSQPVTETESGGLTDRVAAVAGMIAAGVALAVGELLAGLSESLPSLINSVADLVVENGFQSVDEFGRSTFGTNQKTALLLGITVISILIGAITGMFARRNRKIGWTVFALFAFVGMIATAADELASTSGGIFVSIASALIGVMTLGWLLRSGSKIHDAPSEVTGVARPIIERRSFITSGTSFAVFGVLAANIGRTLQGRRNVDDSLEAVSEQLDSTTATPASDFSAADLGETFDELDGITPLISPNDEFYLIDTAVQKPLIDVDSWTLKIEGMVDKPFELTFDELLEMDVVEAPVTLSCVSNEVGGNLVGHAVWRGVLLSDILDKAGVDPTVATQTVGISADGWTAGFPTEVAYDGRTAMVAFAMNGEPLPVIHGFPARLVVSGLYGYVSATKWLTEIRLTTWEDFDGFWIPRGWSKEGPVKTHSRIDVPRRNDTIDAGITAVAGVAWAPNKSVDKVEVSVDGGDWQECNLSQELSIDSWRQWVFEWDAEPGDHQLRVRATDGTGEPQTSELAAPAPNGASGYHAIDVTVV